VEDIILNKRARKKYLIMVLEALNLNISTFVALAYNTYYANLNCTKL